MYGILSTIIPQAKSFIKREPYNQRSDENLQIVKGSPRHLECTREPSTEGMSIKVPMRTPRWKKESDLGTFKGAQRLRTFFSPKGA